MPKVNQMTRKFDEQSKCCNKCGRTFYKRGNNEKIVERQINTMMRLHHKKCKGTKKLTDKEIWKITNRELDMYNSSIESFTKTIEQTMTASKLE